jgi:hypothetical protein
MAERQYGEIFKDPLVARFEKPVCLAGEIACATSIVKERNRAIN